MLNDEIDSDNERDEAQHGDSSVATRQIEIDETAAEKKLRLAKEYIKAIKERDEEGDVNEAIRDEELEQQGKLFKPVAHRIAVYLKDGDYETRLCKNGHSKTVTGGVYHPNGAYVYSCGKDGAVIKWNVKSMKNMQRVKTRPGLRKSATNGQGHKSAVLALAINTGGTHVASGDEHGRIIVWSDSLDYIHEFTDHKKPILGLVFRRGTTQLYSCSVDKTVKVFDLETKSYIETLFGHQDAVQAIDANTRERCITAGGRDNTLRVFKIPEETQLLYRGHHGSIDCVGLLNDEYFVSGGDDGALNFWSAKRKKPIVVLRNAHEGNWITALGVCINSDVFASGSTNSQVKLWRVNAERTKVDLLHTLPLDGGIVTSINWAPDRSGLVLTVGQEHRTGRWTVDKRSRGGVMCIKFGKEEDEESSEEEEEMSE